MTSHCHTDVIKKLGTLFITGCNYIVAWTLIQNLPAELYFIGYGIRKAAIVDTLSLSLSLSVNVPGAGCDKCWWRSILAASDCSSA